MSVPKRMYHSDHAWRIKGGAGMAQWWERSPSTNVSRVQFTDPASYVC